MNLDIQHKITMHPLQIWHDNKELQQICENIMVMNYRDACYDTSCDIYVNCIKNSDPDPSNSIKPNNKIFYLPVADNGNQDEYEKLYKLLIKNDFKLFEKLKTKLKMNRKICIFCKEGRQRSCAVCVCLLIYLFEGKLNKFDAINYVKSIKLDAFFGSINFQKTIDKVYDMVLKKYRKI